VFLWHLSSIAHGSRVLGDFYRSLIVWSIERLLQRCLNKVQAWAIENGFQFSKSNTVCMHFANNAHTIETQHLILTVLLFQLPMKSSFCDWLLIEVLTFIPHIQNLKCLKALNLLRGAHELGCLTASRCWDFTVPSSIFIWNPLYRDVSINLYNYLIR
jgi:hypothetical protein